MIYLLSVVIPDYVKYVVPLKFQNVQCNSACNCNELQSCLCLFVSLTAVHSYPGLYQEHSICKRSKSYQKWLKVRLTMLL